MELIGELYLNLNFPNCSFYVRCKHASILVKYSKSKQWCINLMSFVPARHLLVKIVILFPTDTFRLRLLLPLTLSSSNEVCVFLFLSQNIMISYFVFNLPWIQKYYYGSTKVLSNGSSAACDMMDVSLLFYINATNVKIV